VDGRELWESVQEEVAHELDADPEVDFSIDDHPQLAEGRPEDGAKR
jgi:hypothetical protein